MNLTALTMTATVTSACFAVVIATLATCVFRHGRGKRADAKTKVAHASRRLDWRGSFARAACGVGRSSFRFVSMSTLAIDAFWCFVMSGLRPVRGPWTLPGYQPACLHLVMFWNTHCRVGWPPPWSSNWFAMNSPFSAPSSTHADLLIGFPWPG